MVNPLHQVRRELHSANVFLAELEDAVTVYEDIGYHLSQDPSEHYKWWVAKERRDSQRTVVMGLQAEFNRLLR